MKIFIRTIFVLVFLSVSYYIVSVETERYESTSITLLKDISKKQTIEMSNMFLGQISSTMQDSKVLELYIRSPEMFNYIDSEYNLSKHYVSDELDFAQRLYKDSSIPIYRANKKNIINKYNEDLIVFYDDPSGTLELTFIHTDPETAQRILRSIIRRAEEIINYFVRENAKIALSFIEKQREEKRKSFMDAIKNLIIYQNKHSTIDPSLDVERKITILAELETELVKSEVEYNTKIRTFNPNSREMKLLQSTIGNLRHSIKRVDKELAGNTKGAELNANVFEFKLLKSDMEFAKEVYRQTLINQEEMKIEVAQKSKHLIVVSRPTLPDDYDYPNKPWDIFTLLMVFFFIYSIIVAMMAIVENHKD
ncbi:capsule polysaccharide export system inner membrane protein [Sulfurovum sp. NBC37-1]|uniref:capsule polysaccharide export system inner membrane protein n=1 Tax=Sulfurovum sp. (strain NBC37-1) TaxID=387093 RepID=UPI000158799F|nr:capsule polysaccharide export system inner membrane protein [Sulfurovum sp. NBC37-1]BAF72684.1 capsule polysaccharide export system inner membrane protein [Sulfurovum sp. NBC37-1]